MHKDFKRWAVFRIFSLLKPNKRFCGESQKNADTFNAQVMRSTMNEFRNNDDYLDMWLAPSPKPRRYLSQYGTRRMFYALRQTITAKTPQAAGEFCCEKYFMKI